VTVPAIRRTRNRLFAAVRHCCIIARGQALILIVDDMQWDR